MRWLLYFSLTMVLSGCGGAPDPPTKEAASAQPAKEQPMPDVWVALFDTSRGSFIVEVHKDWAPKGAERFWMLVRMGFFNDTRFYRVRPDFIAQFGVSGDPKTTALLNVMPIDDDPAKQKNLKGTIAFAQSGKSTRRTQVFVNLKDNPSLDRAGFVPFGRVREGFAVFDKLNSAYGEWNPPGHGPSASRIQTEGNRYLDESFPRLDKLIRAKIVR